MKNPNDKKVAFNRIAIATTFALGTSLMSGAADAKSSNLRFASVGIGSSWYAIAAGISNLARDLLPDETTIDVMPIAGTRGNLKLVQAGEAEIGLTFPMPSKDACAGTGWVEGKKFDKVRAIAGGLDNFFFATFVTEASGISNWNEIAEGKGGFNLLTVKVGGEGEIATKQILSFLDSSKEKLEAAGGSVKPASRTATTQDIADGRAQGWAHNAGAGHPVGTQLMSLTGMKVIGLPDVVIKGMVEKYGWQPYRAPANSYEGQTEAFDTITTATNVIVSSDVSDDVAYALTKTIVERADELKNVHSALKNYDPSKVMDPALNGNCPFHPGAIRYYQEAGMMK